MNFYFSDFQLTVSQQVALEKLEDFLASTCSVFMLQGYAGTGKTTILSGLLRHLKAKEKPFVLMAPTGRAAKVIQERTGFEAGTVHRSIYSYTALTEVGEGDSFYYQFSIRNNSDIGGHIFIIDEASMLSDAPEENEFFRFGTGRVLSDLITYTRVAEKGAKTKIIFIGDPAQLPPVQDAQSRAFDKAYLLERFGLEATEAALLEVRRQTAGSGILNAAVSLRKSITSGYYNAFQLRDNGGDMRQLPYEHFWQTYDTTSGTKVIVAARNETCATFNAEVRKRQYGAPYLSIRKGDIIIIGANNYGRGVMNGTFGVVADADPVIARNATIYLKGKQPVQLSWRKVVLVFPEGDDTYRSVEGTILENYLLGDGNLRPEEKQALYVDFKERHQHLKKGTAEFKEAIKSDLYFNCILLKYGYAVTCHKAQGGEWDTVFTLWDYGATGDTNCTEEAQGRKGKDNQQFFRWAYTAVTRASKQLYLLNPPDFHPYSGMVVTDSVVVQSLQNLTGTAACPQEVSPSTEVLAQMKNQGMLDQPLPVQEHYIRLHTGLQQAGARLVQCQRVNYELWYHLEKEGAKACIKTWVDGAGKINGKYAIVPKHTVTHAWANELLSFLPTLPSVVVQWNASETIVEKVVFDLQVEERFPFTRALFDDLSGRLDAHRIVIENVEHHPFRERYLFVRGAEKGIVDFEYNSKGFWGRVVPLTNKCNSKQLLDDINNAVQILKES